MDLNKLQTFYHLAKTGNFSRTAEALNVNQSSVTRQIQDIERKLKVKLFIRHPGRTHLTEEGSVLFDSVTRVFTELESAKTNIQSLSREPIGEIKIATTNALASSWLPLYVPEFLKKYPKVHVSIIGNDRDLDLYVREADVAIRTYADNQPELIQEYLMTFHLGLYASKEYLEVYGYPSTTNDLDNHQLLVFGDYRDHPYGDINWVLKVGTRGQLRTPYLSVNSSQGLHLMAESGLGIAALSEEYAAQNTKLLRVLPQLKGPEIKIYYVYPKGLEKVNKIRALGDFLKNKLLVANEGKIK